MGQINAEERSIRGERGHSKPAIAYEIAFSDLDHAAEFCDTLPLMDKVSTMRLAKEWMQTITVACNRSPEREFKATSTPRPFVARLIW
jgi:hypothetical protein